MKENIERIQKNNIDKNMDDEELRREMKKEKRIDLILDGYRVHKSKIFRRICKTLNIRVITLPAYSPHLNPIEQVWKIIKRHFAYNYTEDFDEIRRMVKEEYYKIVKYSFIANKWMERYIDDGKEFVENRMKMYDIVKYDIITYFSEYYDSFKKYGVI